MNTKRGFTLGALLILAFTAACNIPIGVPTLKAPLLEQGSGALISEERPISEFKILEVNGGGWVNLTQGEEWKLVVEAEDNILPYIEVTMNGDKLEIGYDEGTWKDRIIPTKKITFTLTCPSLEKIILQGGMQLEVEKLEVDSLSMDLSGGINGHLLNLKAETLELQMDGGINLTISGEVATQKVEVNGAANYEAEDLKTSQTDMIFNGAGHATIWALDTFNIRMMGVGAVSYYGDPQVTQDIQGLGSIKSLGPKQAP